LPQVFPSGPFITFLGVSLETEHTRMGKANARQEGMKFRSGHGGFQTLAVRRLHEAPHAHQSGWMLIATFLIGQD
ncbi:MAG: hypothetical protein LGR52_09740, partial [Candidatus Thiosymbion ectosymbiont of Robbea hypermnestra]|nr:hypothetical protein [Candidatus Thiosymbion ectosymbiont of Robbea hypermnestra]